MGTHCLAQTCRLKTEHRPPLTITVRLASSALGIPRNATAYIAVLTPTASPALRHSVSMGLPPQASTNPRTLSKEERSQANAPAAPDFLAAACAFSSVRHATCTSCPKDTLKEMAYKERDEKEGGSGARGSTNRLFFSFMAGAK